jgi:hypothetical protein
MYSMVVALVLLALFVAAVNRYGATTPKVHRVARERLQYALSQLLRRGYNGGIAVIRDPRRQRFVRVTKYFPSDGSMGLDVSVPTSLCAENEVQRLSKWVRDRGLQSRPFESTPERPAVAYPDHFYTHRRAVEVNAATMVAVDCGSDVGVAREMVESIFSEVFDIDHSGGYLVELWGINIKDELVDKP